MENLDAVLLIHLLPNLILILSDVSTLTDTICGVGNMSANASNQERTPWHVIIKVPERRGGTWIPEVKADMGQRHCSP